METYRRTRVEDLNREHPGLEQFICEQLRLGTNLVEISTAVNSQFGVKLGITTLHSYWRRRFAPDQAEQRQAYLNARAKADLLLELQKEGDQDAGEIVKLIVRSQILEKSEELAGENALDLVKIDLRRLEGEGRMEIERGKLDLAQKTLDVEKGKLELENRKLEAQLAKVKGIVEAAQGQGSRVRGQGPEKEFDSAAALRQIGAVIGVTGPMEERVEL